MTTISEINKMSREEFQQHIHDFGRRCIVESFDSPIELSELEIKDYKRFCDEHIHEDYHNGQQTIQVRLVPDTMATMVYLDCKHCNISEDISDTSVW